MDVMDFVTASVIVALAPCAMLVVALIARGRKTNRRAAYLRRALGA